MSLSLCYFPVNVTNRALKCENICIYKAGSGISFGGFSMPSHEGVQHPVMMTRWPLHGQCTCSSHIWILDAQGHRGPSGGLLPPGAPDKGALVRLCSALRLHPLAPWDLSAHNQSSQGCVGSHGILAAGQTHGVGAERKRHNNLAEAAASVQNGQAPCAAF